MSDDQENQLPADEMEVFPAPEGEGPSGPGFWTRLRVAWMAFRGALSGLPVSLDGKVPIEHDLARQELEKKLATAVATADDLHAKVAGQEAELKERAGALKEIRRELKKAQAAADEAEKKLRRHSEKAEEKERAHDEHLARLEARLEEQRTELSQRKTTIQSLEGDLQEAREQANRLEESLRRETGNLSQQLAQRDSRLATLEQDFVRLRSSLERLQEERAEAVRLREEAAKQFEPLRAEQARREAEMEKLRGELEFLKNERAQEQAEARQRWEQTERREAQAAEKLAEAGRQQDALRAELESAWMAAEQAAKRSMSAPAAGSAPAREEPAHDADKVSQLEARIKELEQMQFELNSVERELKRKTQQVETLLGEHGRHRIRAERIEKLLNEFYNEAVSPITVAKATLELMSRPTRKADQENLQEVQQTIELLNQLIAKLRAELASIGES